MAAVRKRTPPVRGRGRLSELRASDRSIVDGSYVHECGHWSCGVLRTQIFGLDVNSRDDHTSAIRTTSISVALIHVAAPARDARAVVARFLTARARWYANARGRRDAFPDALVREVPEMTAAATDADRPTFSMVVRTDAACVGRASEDRSKPDKLRVDRCPPRNSRCPATPRSAGR